MLSKEEIRKEIDGLLWEMFELRFVIPEGNDISFLEHIEGQDVHSMFDRIAGLYGQGYLSSISFLLSGCYSSYRETISFIHSQQLKGTHY